MLGGLSALVVGCLIVPSLGVLPGPLYEATHGDVWPRPFQVVRGSHSYVYDPSQLEFKGVGEKCPLINTAVMRYRHILQKQSRGPISEQGQYSSSPPDANKAVLAQLTLNFHGKCEMYPYLDMDESYRLSVSSKGNLTEASIQANTVWGLMRGLETFSQLSFFNGTLHQLTIYDNDVWDKPRFSHRGLMIDSSRHYLHKRTIKHILEAMEYNKFNVLHWHIVDDQSFPYKSKLFPHLSERGAYNQNKVYSDKDIRELVEYARVRGIRVVPEFDTPGHTQSWGLGQPDLLTKCYSGDTPNGLYGPVDPSNEDNYSFLLQLFTEIKHLFPESYFHYGGDEVDFSCWQSNPNLTDFMTKHGIASNYPKLESLYISKVLNIAATLKKNPVVWQEVFLNDRTLSNTSLVHIWTGNMQSMLSQVTGAGMNAILSTCWYLDHFKQDIYAGGGDWQNFYNCEPLDFPGTVEMKERVLGGEACMWGEYVDDTNIIQRVWPRACSAAERLWSSQFNVDIAVNRLEEHVCRMRSRGILAQPPNGPSSC